MTIAEKATSWAEQIANNNTHGYSQVTRWGPDYDCSSLVISAYDFAGTKVKMKGASYTGNMYPIFRSCEFQDVAEDDDADGAEEVPEPGGNQLPVCENDSRSEDSRRQELGFKDGTRHQESHTDRGQIPYSAD